MTSVSHTRTNVKVERRFSERDNQRRVLVAQLELHLREALAEFEQSQAAIANHELEQILLGWLVGLNQRRWKAARRKD